MYNPITARFLQEDTYRGDAQDPPSLNLYTYCHNEPVMYTDPDGHAELGYGKEFLKLMEHQLITGQIVIPGKKDVLVTQTDKLKEVKVVTKEKYQASGISQQIEREQRQKTVIKRKRQEKQGVNEISKDVLAKLNNTMLCHTSATVNDFSSPMFSDMASVDLRIKQDISNVAHQLQNYTLPDPNSSFDMSMLQLEQSGYPIAQTAGVAGIVLRKGTTQAAKVVGKYGDETIDFFTKSDELVEGTGKAAIGNPLPPNGRFATVMPGKYAEQILKGQGSLAGGPEAWITAADDLKGISTVEGAAKRLTLVDETGAFRLRGDAVVEFNLKSYDGLASPFNRPNSGFVSGGRTGGGAREWLAPSNVQLENLTVRYLER